ncbi:MAG: prohibitin family protein [Saprospiraceae bacterium]|nr:prohibitin family protein [Saprospiraceae bacterium]
MSTRNTQRVEFPGKFVKFGIYGFLLFMLVIILTSTTFITIPPGQKGVMFKRFAGGINKEKIYSQGFHIVAPWNDLILYDVRTNEDFEKMEVLSKNGLTIMVELSYRYSATPDKIGYLHDEIGPQYLDRILKPEIRSATREVIGKYLPEELYSTKREAIQDEIFQRTAESAGKKYIILDAVLIREVALPIKLKEAIEQKLEEEQMSFQYEFKLDRERKEAERKIIEAQAKADANRILNASLTDKILRDKGIEATLELANSPNSKIVIVGGGADGLPLILNN